MVAFVSQEIGTKTEWSICDRDYMACNLNYLLSCPLQKKSANLTSRGSQMLAAENHPECFLEHGLLGLPQTPDSLSLRHRESVSNQFPDDGETAGLGTVL